MGLFQQRPDEEQQDWTGLPSEPIDTDLADTLGAGPAVDPLSIGLGASVNSIVLPVALPTPDAASTENREPEESAQPEGTS